MSLALDYIDEDSLTLISKKTALNLQLSLVNALVETDSVSEHRHLILIYRPKALTGPALAQLFSSALMTFKFHLLPKILILFICPVLNPSESHSSEGGVEGFDRDALAAREDGSGNVQALGRIEDVPAVEMVFFDGLKDIDALSRLENAEFVPSVREQDQEEKQRESRAGLRCKGLFALVDPKLKGRAELVKLFKFAGITATFTIRIFLLLHLVCFFYFIIMN